VERRISIALLCALTALFTCQTANAANLGIANSYNLFVFDDLYAKYSDSKGNIAVGGNATISGYSVASELTGSKAKFVVEGNVNMTGGDVGTPTSIQGNRGDIYCGGTATVTSAGYNHIYHSQNVVDFNAAKTYLTGASSGWSGLASSGTSEKKWGALYLTGTNKTLNVFNVTNSDIDMHTLYIDAPAGSTVLVNVAGTNVSFDTFGVFLTGVSRDTILFNCSEATNLYITGVSFQGSILAPYAATNFLSGNMEGTLVSNSFGSPATTYSGEMHDYSFKGNLPEVPEPATLILVLVGAVLTMRKRKLV